MARLLSILLLLVGLGAAAYGARGLFGSGVAASTDAASSAPVADTSSAPMDAEPMAEAAMPSPAPASEPTIPDEMAEPGLDPDVLPASEPEPNAIDDVLSEVRSITAAPPAGTFDTGDTSAPATTQMSAQDTFLERLKTVPVAHETPAAAEYKRAFDVTFAIDATGDATAADALPGRGVVETGEARVTERVSVRLSGAAFDVVGASPETQVLSPVTENVWRWRATPLSAGVHDLTFEVFAIDQDDVTPLRTYNDTVTVKVSGASAAVAFADRFNPLFVLLGGIGSALAGAFGIARFFMKK